MRTKWFFIILLPVLLAACDVLSGTENSVVPDDAAVVETAATLEPTVESATSDTMTTEETGSEVSEQGASEMEPMGYAGPDWAALQLTDARTGAPFTLADFAGKAVFVEPMATWCSNCRAQQVNVRGAYDQLTDREDVIFISLSVENGLPNNTLADYAERNGFPWLFAVATPELTDALVSQFGRTVVAPPSTPHFTIAPDGTVSTLRTGFHNSDAVLSEVQSLLGS